MSVEYRSINQIWDLLSYLYAVFLQLLLKLGAGLEELPLLGLILLLNGAQFGLQLLLVHGEALHLPLQYLEQ